MQVVIAFPRQNREIRCATMQNAAAHRSERTEDRDVPDRGRPYGEDER